MATGPDRTDGPARALEAYLSVLAGRASELSFLELRYRVDDSRWTGRFFGAHDHAPLIAAIRQRATTTDVYVGCAPRARRAGTKDAVEQVWTLWAECDGEHATRAVRGFNPQPALVIGSGTATNCHAYWPLREPLKPKHAEAANLRLAHALGSDRACYDAARILRPPGTLNHKHKPPTPVTLLRLSRGIAYTAREVIGHLPRVDLERVERRWQDRPPRDTNKDPLLRIAPATYIHDLLGTRPGRDGKVPCPFHDDQRPSLHVYPTAARGWHCYSCGRGGSIYDLAAGLWALDTRGQAFLELRARLHEHFAPELAIQRALARPPALERER